MLYVTIRAFKSLGKFFPAGTVLDMTEVKNIRARLRSKQVTKLPESPNGRDKMVVFIKNRYGLEAAKRCKTQISERIKPSPTKGKVATSKNSKTSRVVTPKKVASSTSNKGNGKSAKATTGTKETKVKE